MARNNDEVKYPRKITEITHLSNSNLTKFSSCPKNWALEYLYGQRQAPTKYMSIGSAVHLIIEKWFRNDPTCGSMDHWSVIPQDEWPSVQKYIAECCAPIFTSGGVVLGIEHEMLIHWSPEAPPILLYIDLLWQRPEVEHRTLRVRDHKTNRKKEGVDRWMNKLQPRIYAWALRKTYGPDVTVIFEVGYVNGGAEVLEFEIPPESDVKLEEEMLAAWRRMAIYAGSDAHADFFPARASEACRYCSHKQNCGSYIEYRESLTGQIEEEDPIKRYVRAVSLKRLAEAEVEDAKEEAERKVALAGGSIEGDNYRLKIVTKNMRSVNFQDVFNAVNSVPVELRPEVVSKLMEAASLKLGELDKILSDHPEMNVKFSKTPSSALTLYTN